MQPPDCDSLSLPVSLSNPASQHVITCHQQQRTLFTNTFTLRTPVELLNFLESQHCRKLAPILVVLKILVIVFPTSNDFIPHPHSFSQFLPRKQLVVDRILSLTNNFLSSLEMQVSTFSSMTLSNLWSSSCKHSI